MINIKFDFKIGDRVQIFDKRKGVVIKRWYDKEELRRYYTIKLDDGTIFESKGALQRI